MARGFAMHFRAWVWAACIISILVALGAATAAHAAPAVLLAAGDIGECDDGPGHGPYRTAELVAKEPGTVLALGDLAYVEGTPEEFAACYQPTWGRFKDRTRPVPGNHEHETPGAAGYFGYWGERAGPDRKGYYSFDLGGWHLVALDSDIADGPAGAAQARWLAADLAGSAARCKLAFFHHPLFSSGMHGDTPELGAIARLLHDARVSVVLSGHDHDYERFAPMDPAGRADPTRGLRSFVVGTGGAELRGFEAKREGSEARSSRAHGVLELVLRADGYDWAFLPVDGGPRFADSGTASCVPAR